MNFKRSFKKCEEFYICCTHGGEGVVHVEKHEDNKTLYAIQAKGSGRFATIFSSDYLEGNESDANFGCMKPFIGKHLIFESYEPFVQYGFNTFSYDQDWDGELVKGSFQGNENSWLVCFKGNPIINGVDVKEMDYAKLENKYYDVQLNDSLVGVFTKLDKDLSVSDFYDDAPIDTWKKVLGNDLHYHHGWGEGDLFANPIKYLYQFISEGDTILDCGCGWGGPAKMLQKDLNCEVTGITISKNQYEYVKNNLSMNILHSDLHDYIPDKKYDACLFVESFCHLDSPLKVLDNLSKYTKKIILRDFYYKTKDYPQEQMSMWLMKIYQKDELISMFEKFDFKLTHHKDHFRDSLESSANFWLNNIDKLTPNEKTHHINVLEKSYRDNKKYLETVLNTIDLATFVFEKND